MGMFGLKSILFIASLLVTSTSAQSPVTCGTTQYSVENAKICLDAALKHFQAGTTVGRQRYPHRYRNFEGFEFPVDPPYMEFPLTRGAAFAGGAPGADRCIINENGEWAGALTHHGATGNGFVACVGGADEEL